MKKMLLLILLFTAVQSFAQHTLKDFEGLYGLKGTWESSRKHGMLTEQWVIINDSSMHGYSYIKNGKDSIPEEKVELVLRAGKISFIADAAGQNAGKPVPFSLYKTAGGKYFFENRSHDFPQQITYELKDSNTLHASIYGPMNGKDITVDFHFKRIE